MFQLMSSLGLIRINDRCQHPSPIPPRTLAAEAIVGYSADLG